MATITLRLSESLLCIFRDSGSPRPETRDIQVPSGTTVREVLAAEQINPLLVPMVSLTLDGKSKRADMDTRLSGDTVLTLYGPLAGG